MKQKYLRRVGGFILATLMLSGIAFVSSSTVQAQGRRRVVIVRRYPYRVYRPFGFGYRSRWDYPYGYDPWGYDPWSPYGSYYRQYVFRDSESAVNQGYKDGFKTGKDDGKKSKSFSPQRSHYYHDAGFGNFAEAYRAGFSRGYQEGYRVSTNERANLRNSLSALMPRWKRHGIFCLIDSEIQATPKALDNLARRNTPG